MSRDISEIVLEGGAYERAVALTDRVFPISLTGKIRLCCVVLVSAVCLAPAVVLRRERIGELEPRGDPMAPGFVAMAAFGITITFVLGLVFVRQRRLIRRRELDFETARRLVRLEDALMAVAVSTGFLFVLVPVGFALLAFSFRTPSSGCMIETSEYIARPLEGGSSPDSFRRWVSVSRSCSSFSTRFSAIVLSVDRSKNGHSGRRTTVRNNYHTSWVFV